MASFLPGALFLREPSSPDVTQYNPVLVDVFVAFQLFGLFGITLMILTAFLSRWASRHTTWLSFSISWVISTVSYTLLFFSGQLNTPSPPFRICVAQSALIYASPPLTSAATLCLVIQIWLSARTVLSRAKHEPRFRNFIWTLCLLVTPYFLFLTMLVAALSIGFQNPEQVRKTGSGMYCNLASPVLGRVSAGLVAGLMIPTLVFEVLVCIILRRNYPAFKLHNNNVAISMIIRVICFSTFGVFSIALSLLFFFRPHHGAALNAVLGIMPIAVVLVFGTQKDFVDTWMFWRKKEKSKTAVNDDKLTRTKEGSVTRASTPADSASTAKESVGYAV